MEKIAADAFEDELQKIAAGESLKGLIGQYWNSRRNFPDIAKNKLKDVTRAIGKHLPGGEERAHARYMRDFHPNQWAENVDHDPHFIPEAVKRFKRLQKYLPAQG